MWVDWVGGGRTEEEGEGKGKEICRRRHEKAPSDLATQEGRLQTVVDVGALAARPRAARARPNVRNGLTLLGCGDLVRGGRTFDHHFCLLLGRRGNGITGKRFVFTGTYFGGPVSAVSKPIFTSTK